MRRLPAIAIVAVALIPAACTPPSGGLKWAAAPGDPVPGPVEDAARTLAEPFPARVDDDAMPSLHLAIVRKRAATLDGTPIDIRAVRRAAPPPPVRTETAAAVRREPPPAPPALPPLPPIVARAPESPPPPIPAVQAALPPPAPVPEPTPPAPPIAAAAAEPAPSLFDRLFGNAAAPGPIDAPKPAEPPIEAPAAVTTTPIPAPAPVIADTPRPPPEPPPPAPPAPVMAEPVLRPPPEPPPAPAMMAEPPRSAPMAPPPAPPPPAATAPAVIAETPRSVPVEPPSPPVPPPVAAAPVPAAAPPAPVAPQTAVAPIPAAPPPAATLAVVPPARPPATSTNATQGGDPAACIDVTANGPAREVDLDMVRRLMRGVDYRRGSFETNAAYRSRLLLKLEGADTLIAERTGRAELVFSLPIPDYRVVYDNETRELTIGSDLGLLRGSSAIGVSDFILVQTNERQIGSHVSSIAYGVKQAPGQEREVKRFAGDQLGIVVPGGSSMGWPTNFRKLRIPMSVADANQIKPSLAVLFVARLAEPYFVTGEFIQEPKADEPVEKRLTVEALRIAIECAAIYDRRSGRLISPLTLPRR